MNKVITKGTFDLGKIAYVNPSRRDNRVEITVELMERGGDETFMYKDGVKVPVGRTPTYIELSICGYIWNRIESDCVCCGQCLDTIMEFESQLRERDLFNDLYWLWKVYHNNGLRAGTQEQEFAIRVWEEQGNKYDYKAACEHLRSIGLYEVEFTGKTVGRNYDHEMYRYGHAWIIQELPQEVINLVVDLCERRAA